MVRVLVWLFWFLGIRLILFNFIVLCIIRLMKILSIKYKSLLNLKNCVIFVVYHAVHSKCCFCKFKIYLCITPQFAIKHNQTNYCKKSPSYDLLQMSIWPNMSFNMNAVCPAFPPQRSSFFQYRNKKKSNFESQ